MSDTTTARAHLAARIRELADLRSSATAAAFATVMREDFLGPGPWAVLDTATWQYIETPDCDSRRVYCDEPIAISRTRLLNNGQPSFVAKLIDALDLRAGERVLHVGCGTGYYSAILATIVGARGRVTAIELDAEIAAHARANLSAFAHVAVVNADGCSYDPGPVDAILINAGATHPCPLWLDRLASGGRLILPLVRWPTDPAESGAAGSGVVIKITRDDDQFHACFVSSVMIFPCIGAANAEADGHLANALRRLSDIDAVRSLRRDRHESHPSCWLHGDDFCVSTHSPILQQSSSRSHRYCYAICDVSAAKFSLDVILERRVESAQLHQAWSTSCARFAFARPFAVRPVDCRRTASCCAQQVGERQQVASADVLTRTLPWLTRQSQRTEEAMKRLVPTLAMGAIFLLPSALSAQGKLDHLICYTMNDQLNVRATVDMLAELQPDFTQKQCRLDGAVEFCVPASKLNVQPPPVLPGIVGQPLQDDYVCYNIHCRDQSEPPDKLVTDQFGRRVERNFRPRRICVPATKAPKPCGRTGERLCGGACPNPGEVCRINPNDRRRECVCVPKPCAGPTDDAGMCGGVCTDPNTRCLPDAANNCVCQPPPPPPCGMNSSAGTCGGTCPNATDQCQLDSTQTKCVCQPPPPPPCGLDPASNTCGGPCPNATDKCVANTSTTGGPPCICQPQTPPCGTVADGTCAGPCPLATDQCVPGPNGCVCQPQTTPCGFDANGVCGGSCPAGQTCKQVLGTANVCTCQ